MKLICGTGFRIVYYGPNALLCLQHAAHGFEVGMKLEAVDKRNPVVIRVATICDVRPSQLLIHFDGWSDTYDYWVDDDSPDMHPPGWCHRTGHELMPPPSQCSNISCENLAFYAFFLTSLKNPEFDGN